VALRRGRLVFLGDPRGKKRRGKRIKIRMKIKIRKRIRSKRKSKIRTYREHPSYSFS
jgi:hypothetical protein